MADVVLGAVEVSELESVTGLAFELTPEPSQPWLDHFYRRIQKVGPPSMQPPSISQHVPTKVHVVFQPPLTSVDEIRMWLQTFVDETNGLIP